MDFPTHHNSLGYNHSAFRPSPYSTSPYDYTDYSTSHAGAPSYTDLYYGSSSGGGGSTVSTHSTTNGFGGLAPPPSYSGQCVCAFIVLCTGDYIFVWVLNTRKLKNPDKARHILQNDHDQLHKTPHSQYEFPLVVS